jgi:hypothetical protein
MLHWTQEAVRGHRQSATHDMVVLGHNEVVGLSDADDGVSRATQGIVEEGERHAVLWLWEEAGS